MMPKLPQEAILKAQSAMNNINGPEMQMVRSLLSNRGLNPEILVRMKCKSMGIDPDEFMNTVKHQGPFNML